MVSFGTKNNQDLITKRSKMKNNELIMFTELEDALDSWGKYCEDIVEARCKIYKFIRKTNIPYQEKIYSVEGNFVRMEIIRGNYCKDSDNVLTSNMIHPISMFDNYHYNAIKQAIRDVDGKMIHELDRHRSAY